MLAENLIECSLCAELLNNQDESLYSERIGKPYNISSRVLYETEHWFIVPTIGACLENYVLLVHKIHTISAAYCNSSAYLELEALSKTICLYNSTIYKKRTILFEHGTIDEPLISGCCVSHTHIHALPFQVDIEEIIHYYLEKAGIVNQFAISTFSELAKQRARQRDYIFYQSPDQNKHVFEPQMSVSQLVRQIIFALLGMANRYDWRCPENYFIKNISKTINHFDAKLFDCYYKEFLRKR